MQQQFKDFASSVVQNAQVKYNFAATHEGRLKAIKDLNIELTALKEAYSSVLSTEVSMPRFNEVLSIPTIAL